MRFSDNTFDLVTCFGVLHHIPNITTVLREIIRVTAPQGIILLREPIRSMGDWKKPRRGLTKNERGIPHAFFDDLFERSDVKVFKKSFCDASFAFVLLHTLVGITRDTYLCQLFDNIISSLLSWNIHYHPQSRVQKLAPASYVVQKI